jgi:hypothetical protein
MIGSKDIDRVRHGIYLAVASIFAITTDLWWLGDIEHGFA